MFPYSAHLDACRKNLEIAGEYQSDRFLSILVEMQQLACKTHNLFPNPDMDGSDPVHFTGSTHAVLANVRMELEALWAKSPSELQESFIFRLCYKGVLARLYEPVIYMQPSPATGTFFEGARRSEALWFCLEAARGFLDASEKTPASQIPHLPCHIFSYFSFALVTTTRLLFLNDRDWNQNETQKLVDFTDITRRLEDHLKEADRLAGMGGRKVKCMENGRSFLSVSAEKLRWLGQAFMQKQHPSHEMQRQEQPPGAGIDNVAMGVNLGMSEFDNVWWEDLLGGVDFGQALEQAR